MAKNIHPRSVDNSQRHRSEPSEGILPNQHHAIQYSAKFKPESQKPVSLAHFMGARRDLKGPVLTKQRIDEKEVRPEGWELAEKRCEIISQKAQTSGGVGSLANLLIGGSTLSSHAANSTKRALPGMVPQAQLEKDSKQRNPINTQRDPLKSYSQQPKVGFDKPTPRSLPQTTLPPTSIPPASHADSYLKPKTLADRMAQLGVSNDVQPIKHNVSSPQPTLSVSLNPSPRLESFKDQANHDSGRDLNRMVKSTSTNLLTSQPSAEEKSDLKQKRPSSSQIPSIRALPDPPSILTDVPPSIPLEGRTSGQALNPRPNGVQPVSGPSFKRNTRPTSTLTQASPQLVEESTATLGVPNKALTASLSRLAGSNIVAQRLQWSKEKEQLGTLDEFGTPILKASPHLGSAGPQHQISSPILPSSNPSRNSDFRQTAVFSERNRNSDESSRENPSLHSPPSPWKSSPIDEPKSPDPLSKQMHQHHKNIRSDEDDDHRLRFASDRDPKRNKKNLTHSRAPSSSNRKENDEQKGAVDTPFSPTSPSRQSYKNRLRTCRRPSGSAGPSAINRSRPEPAKPVSPTVSTGSRQLPSIPSFSPLLKRGTSELAAVWGTQISNPIKKLTDLDHQSSNARLTLTSTSPTGGNRPLPTPPSCTAAAPAHPRTSGGTDTRPLPAPPSGAAPINASSETRPSTRPLPTPIVKSGPSGNVASQNQSTVSFAKPQATSVNVPMAWASHEEKCQRWAALGDPKALVQIEIFQLNRAQSDEFSTTLLDSEDCGTFFSRETLLIICTLKGSKMILLIWKGKDVKDDDDGQTEARIERLLKKYGIERQSKLLMIAQGHEPIELVQALGGRLLLRSGDRFDPVDQRSTPALFTCKSYLPLLPYSTGSSADQVIVIEENLWNPRSWTGGLCSGYCGVLKVYDESHRKLCLYVWKGRQSSPSELKECRLLAQQIHGEGGIQTSIEEVLEGSESDEFLSTIGEDNFARSYHWRYKPLVPMTPLIADGSGASLDRIARFDISIIYTGLEIFVIVPSNRREASNDIKSAMRLAESLSVITPNPTDQQPLNRQRKLAVNCIIFPSLIPIDLLACVRFAADLERLNDGSGPNGKMNLITLHESYQDYL